MTPHIAENFSAVDSSLVTTMPPRDPSDDDGDDEEHENSDAEPDAEPAVVREPDEDE